MPAVRVPRSGGSCTRWSSSGASSPSSFFLVRLTGDPAAFLVDPDRDARRRSTHARRLLRLDRPFVVQYAEFLARHRVAATSASPSGERAARAMRMVLEHFWPATAELARGGAAHRRCRPRSPLRRASRPPIAAGCADHAEPRSPRSSSSRCRAFWLGIMLILLFAVEPRRSAPGVRVGIARHLILPAVDARRGARSPRTCG